MVDKLLKDAIADAKAVRETALANAKLAIQEAFTPKLQSMISSRLRNEAEEDEGTEGDFSKEHGEGVPAGFDHDQKEQDPTVAKGREDEGYEDESKREDEAADVTADGGADPEKEKAGDVADSPKAAGGVEQFEEEAEPFAGKETPEEEDAEEKEREHGEEDETDAELEAIIKELDMEGGDENEKEPVLDEPSVSDEESVGDVVDEPAKGEEDEAVDVTADGGADPEKEKGSALAPENGSGSNTAELPGSSEVELDLEKLVKEVEDELGAEDDENHDDEKPEELNVVMKENQKLSKQLTEHRKVITFLRSKLNEINLLNAKLLFSNKLFRGNSLTEGQRLHVIESIDRANSVREVKLVYATLAEAFKSKVGLNESTKKSVKSSASKTIGSTKPSKTVLVEGTELAERFKRLAGVKKIQRIL